MHGCAAPASHFDRFIDTSDCNLELPGENGGPHLKQLPPISQADGQTREALILEKIAQCELKCNFESQFSDIKNKDIKKGALEELRDMSAVPAVWTRPVFAAFMKMISKNLERDWSPPENPDAPEFDLEEDAPKENKDWNHQILVYEALVKMLESPTSKLEYAKEYVNKSIIVKLLGIFNTQDMRERQEVKTALHRLYSKFVCHRSYIRSAISSVYYSYMYDRSSGNTCIGIAELLEITGSIINGFSKPIKQEHIRFLEKVLVPLHAPEAINHYHPQLAYCVLQYISKDPSLIRPVINGLVRYWPKCNSNKEVMFLNELEELVDAMTDADLLQLQDVIFRRVVWCANSIHFQVAERSLYFFNNQKVLAHIERNADVLIPMIVPVLHHQQSSHWSATITGLAQQMLQVLKHHADEAATRTLGDLKRKRAEDSQTEQDRQAKWQKVTKMAQAAASLNPLLEHRVMNFGIVARSPLPTRRIPGLQVYSHPMAAHEPATESEPEPMAVSEPDAEAAAPASGELNGHEPVPVEVSSPAAL